MGPVTTAVFDDTCGNRFQHEPLGHDGNALPCADLVHLAAWTASRAPELSGSSGSRATQVHRGPVGPARRGAKAGPRRRSGRPARVSCFGFAWRRISCDSAGCHIAHLVLSGATGHRLDFRYGR
jgi:hypothetical protein